MNTGNNVIVIGAGAAGLAAAAELHRARSRVARRSPTARSGGADAGQDLSSS